MMKCSINLIESEMKFNANRRTKSNHVVALPGDETAAAKMGAMDRSAEEKFFSESDKEQIEHILLILSELTDNQRKRLYMKFRLNMSYADIARVEKAALVTIRESCERAVNRLKKHGEFLQNCTIKLWVDWLI